jgi:hypothetical protein
MSDTAGGPTTPLVVTYDKYRAALSLIRDLVDADTCWFDHHGGCQHGYLSLEPGEKCPQQEAKELLAAEGVEV